MNCKKCEKEISMGAHFCQYCGAKVEFLTEQNEFSSNQIEKNTEQLNKKIAVPALLNQNKLSKNNKNKLGLFIGIFIILIIVITILIFLLFKNSENKTKNEDIAFTKEEFAAIVNSYGDAATIALQQYIALTPNTVPTFEEIESNIVFDKHNVECEVSRVNYDYTVYLAGCKVDNFELNENITYGQYLLEPEKTGDKVYVYLQSYPYLKKTTGEKIDNTSYYISSKDPEYDGDNFKYLGLYECYDLNCKAYTVNPETNELLVYDGKYYLYDLDTNTKNIFTELDEKTDEMYKAISYITTGGKVYGLSVQGEKGTALYSIEKQEFLTDFSYDYFQNLNVNALMEKGYIVGYKNHNTYIINVNTGGIYKALEERMQLEAEKIGDSIVYYAVSSNPEVVAQYMAKNIYNENFEEIATSNNGFYNPVSNTNNTITIKEENGFKLYNFDGTLNYTSKQYKEIICIVRDYIVVLDENNNLKVIDLEEKELATLLKVEDNYKLHPMISGYFTENGKNGIYIVIGDDNIPYGTEGSGLEYYYIPSTGETGVIKTNGVGGYAKPVLYLYPESKTKITVDFDKEYLLTTTYPKFKNSWSITAYPNGDLYDKNGNYYYGLYWEEDCSTNVDFSKGFYVSKENAIEFLEEKLSTIGLNSRERNEFIMYWLPILEKNEHNLVYFELTEERELYNKLIITPKPDSLLRVAIHVKKVDGYTKIREQELSTFTRKGFVAVEWGGVVH